MKRAIPQYLTRGRLWVPAFAGMTAKGLIVQNSFRAGLLIYSFFRNYVSFSANLAAQRLGGPCGPVRGTAGWGRQHCRTAPSQTDRPRPLLLFLQPNNSQ